MLEGSRFGTEERALRSYWLEGYKGGGSLLSEQSLAPGPVSNPDFSVERQEA